MLLAPLGSQFCNLCRKVPNLQSMVFNCSILSSGSSGWSPTPLHLISGPFNLKYFFGRQNYQLPGFLSFSGGIIFPRAGQYQEAQRIMKRFNLVCFSLIAFSLADKWRDLVNLVKIYPKRFNLFVLLNCTALLYRDETITI